MATYEELAAVMIDPRLTAKVEVALLVAADTIRTEDPGTTDHAKRMVWARDVILDPGKYVKPVTRAAVIQNRAATVDQIVSASDATLQTAINGTISVLLE